jgi:hypothetical protein
VRLGIDIMAVGLGIDSVWVDWYTITVNAMVDLDLEKCSDYNSIPP